MKKSELVVAMAQASGISRAAASAALDGALDAIRAALREGESVQLVRFGVFEVRARAAHMGRNPQTGEPVQIPASRVPAFRASESLKAAIR